MMKIQNVSIFVSFFFFLFLVFFFVFFSASIFYFIIFLSHTLLASLVYIYSNTKTFYTLLSMTLSYTLLNMLGCRSVGFWVNSQSHSHSIFTHIYTCTYTNSHKNTDKCLYAPHTYTLETREQITNLYTVNMKKNKRIHRMLNVFYLFDENLPFSFKWKNKYVSNSIFFFHKKN